MTNLEICIPGNLQPTERGERFDLPLCDLFDEIGGDIVGSGSRLIEKVVTESTIELAVLDLSVALPRIIEILEIGNAPVCTEIVLIDRGRKQIYLKK